MNAKKEFITIKEASEIPGVSKDALRRWNKAEKLKTKRHPMNNFRIVVHLSVSMPLCLADMRDQFRD